MPTLATGQPNAIAPAVMVAPAAGAERPEITPEQVQGMVSALAERLKAEPDNAEGWVMLGRSYVALERYRDAATALRKASQLMPGNANVLADLADVLGMAQGQRLAGEPAKVIQQALAIDPRHAKTLALAGSAAFEAKDYAAARAYWERLVAVLPADSEIARSVRGRIVEATQLAASGPTAPAAPATAAASAAPASAPAARLAGEVTLKPELAARVAAGDTLFVFARAAQGPRLPLAVIKQPAGSWPFKFVLDDSMAMAPDLTLSGFGQVVVSARVSKSGNATPQPGDLFGQSEPVANSAQGLRIVIDRVQP